MSSEVKEGHHGKPEKPIMPPKKQSVVALKKQVNSLAASLSEHSEILKTLKDVPFLLAQLVKDGPFESPADQVEKDGDSIDSDPITSLLQKTNETAGTEEESVSTDDSLLEILNMTQPVDEFGPDINENVSTSVGRLYKNKQSKEHLDKLKEDHKTPGNCKSLCVPRVNQEIWASLSQRSRQVDYTHQLQQQFVTTASVILSKTADKLFSLEPNKLKEARDDLLKSVLESLTVLGALSQEINQKRKTEIRPFLSKDISTICTSSQSTEWLFGDNLSEQLKTAKAANSIGRSAQPRQVFKSHRFLPYKPPSNSSSPLNWRGGPPSRRGGNRGRYQRGRFYNQSQNSRPFHQNQ